jgi:hypothetical protein
MNGGFGLRFLVELAFLALLALAAGLAELDSAWIIAVMVAGWLLVVLVEWLAWRSEREAAHAAPVAGTRVADVPPGEVTRWDLDDILAPLPDDEDER